MDRINDEKILRMRINSFFFVVINIIAYNIISIFIISDRHLKFQEIFFIIYTQKLNFCILILRFVQRPVRM